MPSSYLHALYMAAAGVELIMASLPLSLSLSLLLSISLFLFLLLPLSLSYSLSLLHPLSLSFSQVARSREEESTTPSSVSHMQAHMRKGSTSFGACEPNQR